VQHFGVFTCASTRQMYIEIKTKTPVREITTAALLIICHSNSTTKLNRLLLSYAVLNSTVSAFRGILKWKLSTDSTILFWLQKDVLVYNSTEQSP
jgi:hypothetical protein